MREEIDKVYITEIFTRWFKQNEGREFDFDALLEAYVAGYEEGYERAQLSGDLFGGGFEKWRNMGNDYNRKGL